MDCCSGRQISTDEWVRVLGSGDAPLAKSPIVQANKQVSRTSMETIRKRENTDRHVIH